MTELLQSLTVLALGIGLVLNALAIRNLIKSVNELRVMMVLLTSMLMRRS